jgi:hypothetical protein
MTTGRASQSWKSCETNKENETVQNSVQTEPIQNDMKAEEL